MNHQATGQLLRFLGMAVEAGSLLGMISVWQHKTDFWDNSPVDPTIVLASTFTLGLVIWIAGLQILRRSRQRDEST